MSTTFNIGVNRNVIFKKQDGELVALIEETGTDKKNYLHRQEMDSVPTHN